MRTHQQSSFYHAPPLNWNPGTSQNTPYSPELDIYNTDQDTRPGMPYERRIWPSEEGMQLNNVQRQSGESTSVATEYRYSQRFQSPFSYPIAPLQSGVSRL